MQKDIPSRQEQTVIGTFIIMGDTADKIIHGLPETGAVQNSKYNNPLYAGLKQGDCSEQYT